MKRFSLIAVSFIFTAVFAASSFAQGAAVPPGKIGLVNTFAFGDEKAGITKFRAAMTALDGEFKALNDEMNGMRVKYQTLAKEIQDLQAAAAKGTPINTSVLQTKIDEAQTLELNIKRKQEDGKTRYERRYQTVVGPVFNDIVKALNEYAKKNGYALILDGAKLEESGLLMGFDDKYDVTKEFVVFYNARPPGTTAAVAPK